MRSERARAGGAMARPRAGHASSGSGAGLLALLEALPDAGGTVIKLRDRRPTYRRSTSLAA